jgi:fido (protein-threonine AMPylation protein)
LADWDADSPRLRRNLASVRHAIADGANRRETPSLELVREWHRQIMDGLDVPDARYVGRFRGEAGVRVDISIGAADGVPYREVGTQLADFESRLQSIVAALDDQRPPGAPIDTDTIAAVADLAGWAHAEWVRIHPFANGNGRTARLWANFLLQRFGLPPVMQLRPRPQGDYAAAGARAMAGDWEPTARLILRMLSALSPVGSTTTQRG